MEKMKRNLFLFPFVAVMTLFVVGFASAGLATNVDVEFSGVELGAATTMVGNVGDVVPVRVTFAATGDAEDVRVKVSMEGHREDVSSSTSRFDIEDDMIYTKLLKLQLPSDSDELSEEYTLYVEVVSRDDRTEESYTISVQRESYVVEVLSADYSSRVSAGDIVPVSVVMKNNGYDRLDDVYVRVSIPVLGVSSRGYVGDMVPTEDCILSEEGDDIFVDNCDGDDEDSREEVVSLKIPESADSGVYELEIEVYNRDAEIVVTKLISIGDLASTMVLAAEKNKDLNAGETVTYDLVIVNSADDLKVFSVEAVSGDALSVSVPSVVTVGPDSSETVVVAVSAASDAAIGTYTFSVSVNGEKTVFGANVVGEGVSSSVIALTVVLVIIFIVLLAVLVVLLTRKEKPIEEVETSYY
jgi:preprotein translocase subunit SecG